MGIREVKFVQPEREGKEAIPKPVRLIIELPARAIAETVRRGPMIFLPTHTGAGPCGTFARCAWTPRLVRVAARFLTDQAPPASVVTLSPSPLAWSIEHLVQPLRAYYAAYVPPMRFGAKPGPRGRRAA